MAEGRARLWQGLFHGGSVRLMDLRVKAGPGTQQGSAGVREKGARLANCTKRHLPGPGS